MNIFSFHEQKDSPKKDLAAPVFSCSTIPDNPDVKLNVQESSKASCSPRANAGDVLPVPHPLYVCSNRMGPSGSGAQMLMLGCRKSAPGQAFLKHHVQSRAMNCSPYIRACNDTFLTAH